MSIETDFIARLVRAANQTEYLSAIEVTRLLERAISAINKFRDEIGIIPVPGKDALIYIRTVAAGADNVPDEWPHALLHAAEMLRDLRIIVDTGTQFTLVERV